MPPRANAGNAHAAREVAIGKAHPRAAEAARVDLLDTKTRLERHALKRRTHRLAARPQRSRRQPYRAHRSRAAHLDGTDHRTVGVNAPRAARAVEAVEREKLAGDDTPRRTKPASLTPAPFPAPPPPNNPPPAVSGPQTERKRKPPQKNKPPRKKTGPPPAANPCPRPNPKPPPAPP